MLKKAHTRQWSPLLLKPFTVTSISLKPWCSFPLFLPLQVKAAAHAELKDKATFLTDTGAAHGDVGWPTCPLVSLNIHWRVDGVRSARIKVVLKNFTSPPGASDWLWTGDGADEAQWGWEWGERQKERPQREKKKTLQAPTAAYAVTLGKTKRHR